MDELYNYFTFFSITFMLGYYIVNNNEIQENISRKLYKPPDKDEYDEIQTKLYDIIDDQPSSNENKILIDISTSDNISDNEFDIDTCSSSSSGDDGFVLIRKNRF